MSEPTFVKTRHKYDSYQDLWKLVEVSGFDTCYIDEIQPYERDNYYIVPLITGEWNVPVDATSQIVHWNMEWFDDTTTYPVRAGIRETWTADKGHAEVTNLRYVPVGSDVGLRDNKKHLSKSPDFDVAMLSYLSPRRQRIHNDLTAAGFNLAPNIGPHQDRHSVLLNTRCILHVHQTNGRTLSPLRLAVAAAYGLPALSEACDNPGIHAEAVPFAEYNNLVEHVRSWLDWGDLDSKAKALHDLLCKEYTFRKCVEEAL